MIALLSLIRKLFCRVLFCIFLLSLSSAIQSQSNPLDEYTVKAGFIYNFIKFTTFNKIDSDVELCVVGDDLKQNFLPLNGKKAHESLIVVSFKKVSQSFASCKVVFVPRAYSSIEKKIATEFQGLDTLTIGESDSFIINGGHVSFFEKNGKVRFAVSAKKLEASSFTLSSKLLRLGRML